jgi:hypothetical protein
MEEESMVLKKLHPHSNMSPLLPLLHILPPFQLKSFLSDFESTRELLEIEDGSGHLNLLPSVIDIRNYEYGGENNLFCHHRGEKSRISNFVFLGSIYFMKV